MRGAVSYPTFIDVSYMVTDPENKYQAVYIIITGQMGNDIKTEKIIVDKYSSNHRITGLTPNSEYSISLGYIEVITDEDTQEKSLVDNIEDVINIRTTKTNYTLKIEKISNGNVYFNYKMNEDYSFQSADAVLYSDGNLIDTVKLNGEKIKSSSGESNKLKLNQGLVFEIKIENAIYNDKEVDLPIAKSFTIP